MGVTNSNKVISTERIGCDGTLRVTLALTAAPDIISNPVDIALVLDRSGSMAGIPLDSMKNAVSTFVDIIAESTGGLADGQIAGGSRIGIVSFSDTAVANTQLITSVEMLKNAVGMLTAGGMTNHASAFSEASALFDPTSSNAKVMVMFTDGNTTTGALPAPVAAAARTQGITIYCIGLVGADGLDVNALNNWATDPDASHVAVTPDAADLEALFAQLAANISKTGATNIVINEVVHSDFIIVNILQPEKGAADLLDSHSIRWTIPALGENSSESAVLAFQVRHIAAMGGVKAVNQSIVYSDAEGNTVSFPDPKVTVDCDIIVHPDPCPRPVELTAAACKDAVVVDVGSVHVGSSGQIIELNVTIRKVCPGKRVALAAILTEVDSNGAEYQRGMKTMTIPPHCCPTCRDVQVQCIRFVVPEDLAISDHCNNTNCTSRRFYVRFISNYVDTDYQCCAVEVKI